MSLEPLWSRGRSSRPVLEPVIGLDPLWKRTVPLVTVVDDRINARWFLKELHRRNFPPAGEPEQSSIILISGNLRSSKSTTAAKLILGSHDMTYLDSLQYHPANGGHSGDDWRCHLSISPGPFIDAVAYELERVYQQQPQEYLVRGSWWHFDEPTELKSTEWWTQLAKDVADTMMENAFLGINVVLCTPMRGKVLTMLRDLSNYWIRMYKPGWGMVHDFINKINYKSAGRPEIRVPKGVCPVTDFVDPRDDPLLSKWKALYDPIKVWNARNNAVVRSARWKLTKAKQGKTRKALLQPVQNQVYVS